MVSRDLIARFWYSNVSKESGGRSHEFQSLSNKDNIELSEHVLHPTWPEHPATHSNATKPPKHTYISFLNSQISDTSSMHLRTILLLSRPPIDAMHNVYFVKYDVTVSFMAQVLDTVTYFVSQVLDTASQSNCLVRFYRLAI